MTRILISRRLRLVAMAMLLPALMLRALIPTGFMPASGTGTVLAIQMCSAVNPGTVTFLQLDSESRLRNLGAGDQPAPGHDDEDRGTACEFALASAGTAPPPASSAVVLATLDRELRPVAVPDLAPIASLPDHAQQPRAPPRHS